MRTTMGIGSHIPVRLMTAALLCCAGCSGSRDHTATPTPSSSEIVGDRRIPFSPANDLEFAEFFVAHHQMAIDAAMIEVENGSDAGTKALAQRIIDSQGAQVASLQAAIAELQNDKAPPPMPDDPHMQAEMDQMMSLSGSQLDDLFLVEMIAHHASAIAPAHRARSSLVRPDLAEMATNIIEAQATEIGEIRTMLVAMTAMDAGEDLAPATGSRPDFGLVGDRRVPFTPADDADFVDFFVPHHQAAIAMAEEEIARGSDPGVVSMAQSMRDTQSMEIATMQQRRQALTGSSSSPAVPPDAHMQAEMATMKTLSGSDLDQMFLQEMIPHHAAALPTAHRARPHLEDPKLGELAQNIYDAQAKEAGEMEQMLEQLGAKP